MIPKRYIEEWKEFAPWHTDAQIEQDLIIERALIAIFSNKFLSDNLAFRGGTALHKIYLKPQARYSEDIDLVQIKEGSIGKILDKIKEVVDFFEIKPKVKIKANNNNVIFRFNSEIQPIIPMRLKIEINCREHFSVLGYKNLNTNIDNGWFKGSCILKTYELEELLATKLRALYQRKKGRDLFDLFYSVTNAKVDFSKILFCWDKYMNNEKSNAPSKKEFILNIEKKMQEPEFTGDIFGLLRPDIKYDNSIAYELIKTKLLDQI